MPNIIRYSFAFMLTASSVPGVASAQQAVQSQIKPQINADAGKQKMDLTLPGVPLEGLLDEGWFIQSIGGSEGQVLILFKSKVEKPINKNKGANDFLRCVLTSQDGNGKSVNVPGILTAACRSLN